MKKSHRIALQILSVAAVLVAGTLVLFLGRSDPAALPDPAKPVVVEQPDRSELSETVEAWGNLVSANQVPILPRVAGTLQAVYAEAGDRVEEGDLLAEIDSRAYALDYEQALAARDAAASTWERMDRLHDAGNATGQDWEDARAAYLAAEAQASAARLRRNWTRVEAPASGTVLVRHVNVGALVAPEARSPLFTIGSVENLELRVRLPESRYPAFTGEFRPALQLRADSFPNLRPSAEITSVAPWVDPATRSFEITCKVSGEEDVLRPGMLMKAEFVIRTYQDVLSLPAAALTEGAGVWIVNENGTATLENLENPVLVSGRLLLGDEWESRSCIVEGQHFLRDGDRLRILNGGELQ